MVMKKKHIYNKNYIYNWKVRMVYIFWINAQNCIKKYINNLECLIYVLAKIQANCSNLRPH